MKVVDARGRSCPEPVIMAKNGLETDPAGIEILLDTHVSVENVSRLAKSMGYQVSVAEEQGDFHLTIKK